MYSVRKVRNEDYYCIKCRCGYKRCIYRNSAIYISDKEEAKRAMYFLNKENEINDEYIYDLNNNIIITI
jgi:hypothetical protein